MKETMDVLKKNDIYDQSLIVFKSDHGKLREEKLNSSNVLLFKNHSNLLPKALK
jgi:arylsulfatase A-like enzyme